MKQKKILVFIDWYIPGNKAGGLIQGCKSVLQNLKDYYDIKIITADRDLKTKHPYDGIPQNEWTITHDNISIMYLSPDQKKWKTIKNIIKTEQPDFLYCNNIYSLYFTMLPIIAKRILKLKSKVIITSHGMLLPLALKIKSIKKKIFFRVARIVNFYKDVRFHVTSDFELKQLKKVFGKKAESAVAIYPPYDAAIEKTYIPKNKGELELLFLARIHPIKNLHKVVEYLASVHYSKRIIFSIYGNIEDEKYWHECWYAMSRLSDNITCLYKGFAKNSEVINILKEHHVSILPSQSENFGHSIIESLIAGCPVIISDSTPWHHLQDKNVGWDINLEEQSLFVKAIEEMCDANQIDYQKMQDDVYDYAYKVIHSPKITEDFVHLFS